MATRLDQLKEKTAVQANVGSGVKDGWFSEQNEMWPGQALTLKVKEELYSGSSQYQDIRVFKSESHGNVLVLDGVIQCTEVDEFSYHEMITHLPLCALPKAAKRVLVIGGGDGGVLREIGRHESVEHIEICELDEMVAHVSKKHLKNIAVGYDDPRVQCHWEDGFKFLKNIKPGTYDAIIVDSSDPVGPAATLFQKPFFDLLHSAINDHGVICTQAECMWLHLDIIQELKKLCMEVFENGTVTYAYCSVPTYPSGQIGFMLCTKTADFNFSKANQPVPLSSQKSLSLGPLKYYNSEVHAAAFALPQFMKDTL